MREALSRITTSLFAIAEDAAVERVPCALQNTVKFAGVFCYLAPLSEAFVQ